jgi:ElaB/YqjD/DUF883 family membrane-anchored ribosome-binding protein
MTPIDQHLYDDSRHNNRRSDQATRVATPPQTPTEHHPSQRRPPHQRVKGTEATGLNVAKMKQILHEQGRHVADAIDPLQKSLDLKLHELDDTLRPKLQQPVKEKPLLAVAMSAGAGMVIGALGVLLLMAGGHEKR